jgi:cellulose synthase/poly-beta-1,6-N-acetylglucosamine synthase-like glycosyltransferase
LDKSLVSVIVAAFEAEATIRQTLSSVLAQTYQEIEVMVVDDGSSDANSAIVGGISGKRCQISAHPAEQCGSILALPPFKNE